MDIIVSKKKLYNSLSHFQSVVEKRNTIPILSNVKLKSYDNKLEITATDLGLEITENILANIKKEGELTLPSQILFDIVRKAPENAEIQITEDQGLGQVFVFFWRIKIFITLLINLRFP